MGARTRRARLQPPLEVSLVLLKVALEIAVSELFVVVAALDYLSLNHGNRWPDQAYKGCRIFLHKISSFLTRFAGLLKTVSVFALPQSFWLAG